MGLRNGWHSIGVSLREAPKFYGIWDLGSRARAVRDFGLTVLSGLRVYIRRSCGDTSESQRRGIEGHVLGLYTP